MTRPLALIGLFLGAFALTLQFSLSIPASMANGASLTKAILLFVSFLTIISNSGLVLIYLSALTGWQGLSLPLYCRGRPGAGPSGCPRSSPWPDPDADGLGT